ncbi:MAG: MoaD/ThiS family protein [Armatimonadota bacterium]|nr:MoaD/ThiS family protein [Armatimonadota bacterium]
MTTVAVRVWLPTHLRRLCGLSSAVVDVTVARPTGPLTLGDVLDALEHAYPALRGTIRDHPAPGAARPGTLRPYIRCFAAEVDLTPAGVCATLPEAVADGTEVLRIVGAIAGGEHAVSAVGDAPPIHPCAGAVGHTAAGAGGAVRTGVRMRSEMADATGRQAPA